MIKSILSEKKKNNVQKMIIKKAVTKKVSQKLDQRNI
jgi:hypothetical protein